LGGDEKSGVLCVGCRCERESWIIDGWPLLGRRLFKAAELIGFTLAWRKNLDTQFWQAPAGQRTVFNACEVIIRRVRFELRYELVVSNCRWNQSCSAVSFYWSVHTGNQGRKNSTWIGSGLWGNYYYYANS
jgi:hypothetical protein